MNRIDFWNRISYSIDMLTKIIAYVKKNHMIAIGDTIVAGISGGADSVCLLFVLLELQKEIPFTLSVVHVNHGVREEAKEEAAYVQKLCREQKIACSFFDTNIRVLAEEKGVSEEEAGRDFRYRCFQEALDRQGAEQGKIAVAHHMGDRAETMLFNLFRGSGTGGMAGIRPVRGKIIRPLLCMERKEIEDFLESRQIDYCTDRTNQEDIYTRNRIRHHILPYAEEINHNAVKHMSAAADYLWETEEYIRKQTEIIAGKSVVCISNQAEIDIKELLKQEPLIQKRIFMYALEQIISGRKNIATAHITGLMHIVRCQGSREIHLPYGLCGVKEYDKIIIKKRNGSKTSKEIFLVADFGSLTIPNMGILKISKFSYNKNEIIPQKKYTKWFDYDKITTSAIFRTRQQGDYLIINRAGNRKTLKEYMINEKISKEDREGLYILADGSHIMWIPGHRVSEHYKVDEQTKTVLELRMEGKSV